VDEVREGILAAFAQLGRELNTQSEASLIDQGVLDSLSILELISALEQRFDLEFDDESLTGESFSSLASIESLVHSTLESARDS